MSRNDDGFNLDDMLEIFGEAVPASAQAPAVATKPAPPPAPVAAASEPEEDPGLSAEELAILEAYEKQKQEKHRLEEQARRQKEEEAKRILEDYERAQRETEAREAQERQAREAQRQKELEELKKKEEFKVDAERLAEEERRIIEEFERSAADQKAKQDEERKAKEAEAQAGLQRLADQQRADDLKRKAEQAAKDAELQAQAQAVSKKDSRLLELLAKAQSEIKATGLPPLPAAAPLAAAASSGPKAADILLDIEVKENEAFCAMLDETRKAMFTFLAPLIGIKASNNMLNKSVEKARAKAPVVLKDANWRTDGSLRDDGSVDPERLLKNVAAIPAGTRVDEYLAGFRELMSIRFKAVEAGLGGTTAGEMKNRVLAAREQILKKKVPLEWVDLFFRDVVA